MKKILILIFITLALSGCYTTYKKYRFGRDPIHYTPNKKYEYEEYIYMYTELVDNSDKNSPLKRIVIGTHPVNSRSLEIINKKAKITYKGKEYYLPIKRSNKGIIDIYAKKLNITDEFELYIGKVKVGNATQTKIPYLPGKTLDIPTFKFIKYVKVIKYIPILDALNQDTVKKVYFGPLKDYKKK